MVEFKLPDIGEGMHEAEIISWCVKEGDSVVQDQPIVEVQTDKVNAELSSPATGVISAIYFKEGDTVEVGSTLFTIQTSMEASIPIIERAKTSTSDDVSTVSSEPKRPIPSAGKRRALATPYVRQLARELSIQLNDVIGTGPAGRITETDLKDYVAKTRNAVSHRREEVKKETSTLSAAKQENYTGNNEISKILEERILLKGIRKKIAEHMVKSVSTIPHVTHVDEIEMDALHHLKEQLKEKAKNHKLTYLPFFIKAVVIALKEYRLLNASIDESTNEIILKNYYHIGIATNTEIGLIVPVIKNADQKTILELASEITELATLAKEGKLTINQVNGSTFTISNVGPFGGLYATPIINYPEAAILALHKMEPRMVVRNWEGVIRQMMNMSLSFDHRLIDGVTAVQFTNRIKELLENPNLLFLELS